MAPKTPAKNTMKKGKKEKKVKDPNAPKRPKSAYFFFMDDRRAELKAANPEMNVAQLGKLMGEEWNKIKESSAADKYKTQADADKARYTKEMAAYKK